MERFHITFALSRRQRLAVELPQWLPAIAGSIGFSVGAVYLCATASRLFVLLLLIPVLAYRGLFAFLFDIVTRGGRPVALTATDTALEVRSCGAVKALPLEGIFQVFCAGGTWTVLHLDGTVITVPAEAIAAEQIAYLRSFARRAQAARA